MFGSVYSCGDRCECMYVTSLVEKCMIDGGEAAQTLGYVTKNVLSCVLFYTLPALIKGTLGCDCDCVKADGLACIILPKKLARRSGACSVVENGG